MNKNINIMNSIDNEFGITEKMDENNFSKLLKRLIINYFIYILYYSKISLQLKSY